MIVSAILAAAGRGTRLGAAAPKQMIMLGERTILQHSFDLLDLHEQIEEIVIALPPDLARSPPAYLISPRKPVRIVDGGARRQDSVANAFEQVLRAPVSSSFTTRRAPSRRPGWSRASSRRRQDEARRSRRFRRAIH